MDLSRGAVWAGAGAERDMRIFMLGWEFPPFITGGLGTACYGLTKAMSQIGTDVLFVLPKPIETTLEKADAMIAAAHAAGVHLLVAETARFNAAYLRAAEWIHSMEVEHVDHVRLASRQSRFGVGVGRRGRLARRTLRRRPATAFHLRARMPYY